MLSGCRALEETSAPTTLSALAAEVATDRQGQGISGVVIAAMAEAARNAGLDSLVAPVRPSWKDRYPLTPIEDYATWVREDGLPFDPWMRVHARLGATTLRPEPHSMQISGSVAEWERWTGMAFPTDGEFVVPGRSGTTARAERCRSILGAERLDAPSHRVSDGQLLRSTS